MRAEVERDHRPEAIPRGGASPPTTDVPPPNGTTATPSSEQAAARPAPRHGRRARRRRPARPRSRPPAARAGPGRTCRDSAGRGSRGRRAARLSRPPLQPLAQARRAATAASSRTSSSATARRQPRPRRRAHSAGTPPRARAARSGAGLAPAPEDLLAPAHARSSSACARPPSASSIWRRAARRRMNGASRVQPRSFCSKARRHLGPGAGRSRVAARSRCARRGARTACPRAPAPSVARLGGSDDSTVQSARTLRPRCEIRTFVQPSSLTPSTRSARGHQRGRC